MDISNNNMTTHNEFSYYTSVWDTEEITGKRIVNDIHDARELEKHRLQKLTKESS